MALFPPFIAHIVRCMCRNKRGACENDVLRFKHMTKLIVIMGAQAVGKMTVGQELSHITDFKLFHNHMTLDLVSAFFSPRTEEGWDLLVKIRYEMLSAFARSKHEGIIFTFAMNFDNPQWVTYIDVWAKLFEDNGGSAYFVELEAAFESRLERNRSENRLLHKPSKKNIERSEEGLRFMAQHMRMNTHADEQYHTNWLKINNTNISAKEAARIIKDKFAL